MGSGAQTIALLVPVPGLNYGRLLTAFHKLLQNENLLKRKK
jgi:hypothetical protein